MQQLTCKMVWSVSFIQKPGDHPNFRKNALGVKRPFSELSESSGVFSEQLSEFEIPFSEYEISFSQYETHDLSNTKATILGATSGAILGIDGHPHERFSFAPSFSERFFQNWGGPPRAPFILFKKDSILRKAVGEKV